MTYGPFRPGDLSPELFRDVPIGSFFLAEEGPYFAATWPAESPGDPVHDVVIQFAPGATPHIGESLNAKARCLVLQHWRLEAWVAGVGANAEAGHLGINKLGEVAIAFTSSWTGGTLFVHLGTGTVSSTEPQGFFWSSTWRLDLVLGEGHARIELAGHGG